MSDEWLKAFDLDCEKLFDLLLPEIDDGMLLEIAQADYGFDVGEFLAPLKLFRDTRAVPVLKFCPREVLELISYSQPEDPDWAPGSQGRRGHFLRAFVCSVMLRSYARKENEGSWFSFNEPAVRLADSLRVLGVDFVSAGVKFFAWCVERLTPLDPDEGPFLGIALLSLSVQCPTPPNKGILQLCSWISTKVEILLSTKQWWATDSMNWLLSTNHHNSCNGRWIEIGRELQAWAQAASESDETLSVALIGTSLAESQA